MDVIYLIIENAFFSIIPLLIVAFGGLYSERSGVTNIALEGQMLMGAFVGIWLVRSLQQQTTLDPQMIFIIAMLVGGIIGGLFSLLHAYSSIVMKSDQIISATALNLFAPAFAVFTARTIQTGQQIQFRSNFLIRKIPILSDIPIIGEIFFTRIYLSLYVAIIVLFVGWFVLMKTKFGLRLRACGENPHAADSLGVNIYKIRFIGVLISGFLAGLGGVAFIISIGSEFNATVSGFGFLAIAVLIFGNWKPFRILFAAVVFGLLRSLASSYYSIPFIYNLDLPTQIYGMLPYLVTLLVLVFFSKSSKVPKALGQIYDQGKR
jgi:general nucleoside transport system permease protein